MTAENIPPEKSLSDLMAEAHQSMYAFINSLQWGRVIKPQDLGSLDDVLSELSALKDPRTRTMRLRGRLILIDHITTNTVQFDSEEEQDWDQAEDDLRSHFDTFYEDDDEDEEDAFESEGEAPSNVDEGETLDEIHERIKLNCFEDIFLVCHEILQGPPVSWEEADITLLALREIIAEELVDDDAVTMALDCADLQQTNEKIESLYVRLLMRADINVINPDVIDAVVWFSENAKSTMQKMNMLNAASVIASKLYLRDEVSCLFLMNEVANELVSTIAIEDDDTEGMVVQKTFIHENIRHLMHDGKIPGVKQLPAVPKNDPAFVDQDIKRRDLYKQSLKLYFLERDYIASVIDFGETKEEMQQNIDVPKVISQLTMQDIIDDFNRGLQSNDLNKPGCRMN